MDLFGGMDQVSFEETKRLVGLFVSCLNMVPPLKFVCHVDSKVLGLIDLLEFVPPKSISAFYWVPLPGDSNVLTLVRVKLHPPGVFPPF